MERILGPRRVGDELQRLLRSVHIKQLIFARRQAAQNPRMGGHGNDAGADALQVDLNGLDRFFLLFLFFLFFLFLRFLFAAFHLRRFLFVLLLVLLFFVALRSERRGFARLQGNGEDSIGCVVVVPLIQLSAARIKIPRGKEEQIFAGGIEDRVGVVVEALRNFCDFFGAERVEKHIVAAAPMRLRIREPQAVRGPAGV